MMKNWKWAILAGVALVATVALAADTPKIRTNADSTKSFHGVAAYDGTSTAYLNSGSAANQSATVSGARSLVVARPGDWAVNHQPAVNTAAVASKAAGASGVRHVATGCYGSIATVATQTRITLNLRDGATGAGTIVWSQTVACLVGDPCVINSPTLNIVGTAATAMTCEWSGTPVTNNFEQATLTGYSIN